MGKLAITEDEIMAKQTPKGGWTREQLAEWKVPWPPPRGWKKIILDSGGMLYVDAINAEMDKECDQARDRDHVGETVRSVVEVLDGAKIMAKNKPLFCAHCDSDLVPEYKRLWNAGTLAKELLAVLERRKGKIVERVWPNGQRNWGCHYCGRGAKPK
jgi:hypothetical protein